ncbi:MAG: hypothetical protein ABF302_04830, partial [Polaribacter sp.]
MEKELFYSGIYNLFRCVLEQILLFFGASTNEIQRSFLRDQQINISKRKVKPVCNSSIGKHAM